MEFQASISYHVFSFSIAVCFLNDIYLDNKNPIVTIHDVGAGGLSNAIPEIINDSKKGGKINLESIPVADKSMNPLELWCNESQERYVLIIKKENIMKKYLIVRKNF